MLCRQLQLCSVQLYCRHHYRHCLSIQNSPSAHCFRKPQNLPVQVFSHPTAWQLPAHQIQDILCLLGVINWTVTWLFYDRPTNCLTDWLFCHWFTEDFRSLLLCCSSVKKICLVDVTGQDRPLPGLGLKTRLADIDHQSPDVGAGSPWKVGFSECRGIQNRCVLC